MGDFNHAGLRRPKAVPPGGTPRKWLDGPGRPSLLGGVRAAAVQDDVCGKRRDDTGVCPAGSAAGDAALPSAWKSDELSEKEIAKPLKKPYNKK